MYQLAIKEGLDKKFKKLQQKNKELLPMRVQVCNLNPRRVIYNPLKPP